MTHAKWDTLVRIQRVTFAHQAILLLLDLRIVIGVDQGDIRTQMRRKPYTAPCVQGANILLVAMALFAKTVAEGNILYQQDKFINQLVLHVEATNFLHGKTTKIT